MAYDANILYDYEIKSNKESAYYQSKWKTFGVTSSINVYFQQGIGVIQFESSHVKTRLSIVRNAQVQNTLQSRCLIL